ncbi:MAG: hypothetical protein GF384_07405 [Elusimicrobia bacterium]|nr:hypothetical protein [Elusimicrobiota bacterium]MBD3412483.1 hypothetical protein [Elusimicrobiota bacterium]
MSDYSKQLYEFLIKEKNKRISGMIIGSVMNTAAIVISLMILSAWVDFAFPLPASLRMVLRYFFILLPVGYIMLRALTIYRLYTVSYMAIMLQKEMGLNDRIINALQLGQEPVRQGISSELTDEYVQTNVKEVVKKSAPSLWKQSAYVEPFTRMGAAVVIALILSFVPPRIFPSFFMRLYGTAGVNQIYRFIDIAPKDIAVAEGSDLVISIKAKTQLPAPVQLFLKTSRVSWEEVMLRQVSAVQWEYRIDHVIEKIWYYAKLRDMKTGSFAILPQAIPRIVETIITYRYPSYTGKPEERITNYPFIQSVAGTVVDISVQMNIPVAQAELVFGDARKIQASIDGTTLAASFVLDTEGSCRWVITDLENNIKTETVPMPIKLDDDFQPQISILAPAEDLITAADHVVPITYQATDDFGITRITLVYRKQPAPDELRKILQRFTGESKTIIDDYSWKIASLGLGPGERVEYFLEAEDNNVVTGPSFGRSGVYTIEIISYEREHERISSELDEFREDILDVLADQILAHESLKTAMQSATDDTKQLVDEISHMQDSVTGRLDRATKKLGDLLPAMEKDPLGDSALFMEHQAMHRNLESLINGSMKNISPALESGRLEQASGIQESVIAELEKLSILSEDLEKKRAMQDLVNTADALTNKADGMVDRLQGFDQTMSPEDVQELNQVLEELSDMMAEIQKMLKEVPQELPEDFVNQEAVQSIDTREMNQLGQDLSQALQQGNIQQALSIAQAMAEAARNMLSTLREAATNSLSHMGETDSLASDLQQRIQELEQITHEQEQLLQKTRPYETLRKERLYEEQEKLLDELHEKQKQLIDFHEDLFKKRILDEPSPGQIIGRIRPNTEQARKLMGQVLNEFAEKRVLKSQEYLEKIIDQYEVIIKQNNSRIEYARERSQNKNLDREQRKKLEDIEKYYVNFKKKCISVQTGEQEILEKLRSVGAMKPAFSASEQRALGSLGDLQEKLSGRTRSMTEQLEKFSRQTALIGPEIFNQFRDASSHMHHASEELGKQQTQPAVESEESALEALKNGKEALQQSLSALQAMSAAAGQPMSGFLRSQGGPGVVGTGVTGVRTGHVHIPSADEYVPPQDFREEIMKSMQEDLPEVYEPAIKEYYKRITR